MSKENEIQTHEIQAAEIALVLSTLLGPLAKDKKSFLDVMKALEFVKHVLEFGAVRFESNISDADLELNAKEAKELAQTIIAGEFKASDETLN